jgi:hypothetical protein
MGLRALLGLCEHTWKPIGRIEHSVGLAQGFGEKIIIGYSEVRECERCGAVKAFRL